MAFHRTKQLWHLILCWDSRVNISGTLYRAGTPEHRRLRSFSPLQVPLAHQGMCPNHGAGDAHPMAVSLARAHVLQCGLTAAPPRAGSRRTCCVSKSWQFCVQRSASTPLLVWESFLCLPAIASAKRSKKRQHLAPLIFIPPAFGDGRAPGRWADRALVPLTLSLSAGLGITGRLHSEHVISTLPSI